VRGANPDGPCWTRTSDLRPVASAVASRVGESARRIGPIPRALLAERCARRNARTRWNGLGPYTYTLAQPALLGGRRVRPAAQLDVGQRAAVAVEAVLRGVGPKPRPAAGGQPPEVGGRPAPAALDAAETSGLSMP
jgi:hypothetical protein